MMRERWLLALFFTLAVSPVWAAPPCWKLDGDSTLMFVGQQAGAPARGRFKDFSVRFCFDPDQVRGTLDVSVNLRSVDTQNDTRDETLRGPDFFDVEKYPRAEYHATSFKTGGDRLFHAKGTLRLHGVTKPVPVEFSFRRGDDKDTAETKGEVSLNRRHFNVGQGRWDDTRWVGARVRIAFDLKLTRAQ